MSGVTLETLKSFSQAHYEKESIVPVAKCIGIDAKLVSSDSLQRLDYLDIARNVGTLITQNENNSAALSTVLNAVRWLKADTEEEYNNMSTLAWILELIGNAVFGTSGSHLGKAITQWESIENSLEKKLEPKPSLNNILTQLEWGESVHVTVVKPENVDYSKNRVAPQDLLELTATAESHFHPLTIHLNQKILNVNHINKKYINDGDGYAISITRENQETLNEWVESRNQTEAKKRASDLPTVKEDPTTHRHSPMDVSSLVRMVNNNGNTLKVSMSSFQASSRIDQFDRRQLTSLLLQAQAQGINLFIYVSNIEELKIVHQAHMKLFGNQEAAPPVTVLYERLQENIDKLPPKKIRSKYSMGDDVECESTFMDKFAESRAEEKGFKYCLVSSSKLNGVI